MAKVALIDSGIDPTKANLLNAVKFSTGFSIINGYITEDKTKEIRNMHATAIAQTITLIAGDTDFLSINIFNENLKTDFRVLLYALYYTLENLRPDIIHLSLSSTKLLHYFYLKDIVRTAINQNIIIVASVDNSNKLSFPACMKGVIGVKAFDDIYSGHYYYDRKYFLASARLPLVPGIKLFDNQNFDGSSISAAYITGHIIKIIQEEGRVDRVVIMKKIKEKALKK